MTLFDLNDVPAAPTGPLVRVRLTVAYDGRPFHGISPNHGVRTVGGTLIEALERILRAEIHLSMAGRTDAGVHAWGQVVSFDAPADRLDLVALQRSVNSLCGPAIAVREAAVMPHDYDARHSATGRRYRYTVLNRPVPDPFLAATTWHVEHPLDLATLRLACDPLIGEHDFSTFCKKPRVPPGIGYTMTRSVRDARWHDLGDGVLRFDIEASAFCQQMVRSLVGTLVEVGLGKRRAGDLRGILAARDRQQAGEPAPAHGLCLWEVLY